MTTPSPLFSVDKATITLAPQHDGSLRVTYQGWDEAKIILKGEGLKLVTRNGQVQAFRTIEPVVKDPYEGEWQ